MIFSNKQLSIAQRELENLVASQGQAALRAAADGGWIAQLEADALDSQIADMEVEIQEYMMLIAKRFCLK